MDEYPIRDGVKHNYLHWIQRTPRKAQAILVEPICKTVDTPENFYHTEMLVRSDLTERFLAHGGQFSK
jgi:hypothetical protein